MLVNYPTSPYSKTLRGPCERSGLPTIPMTQISLNSPFFIVAVRAQRIVWFVAFLLIFFFAGSLAQAQTFKILVFTKSATGPHPASAAGVSAIQALGAANSFTVDST